MKVLLTGGAGFIGSHTAVSLAEAGHELVLYDNFSNSRKSVVESLARITGYQPELVQADVRDVSFLAETLSSLKIDAVVHFAGLKSVNESVQAPIEYYSNNVHGTICLLQAMEKSNVKRLVFSSSAAVYGEPNYLPLDEDHPLKPTTAYGRTKLHIEEMLKDVAASDPSWKMVSLRYFNPVGAHESGLIGEESGDIPNNLMPYISQVAAGELPCMYIFGNDYPTPDGTGVRDYIHVMDLAEGHLAAFDYLRPESGYHVFNLGTGQGYSVLEMIRAFEAASGKKIPFEFTARRKGDVASCYASADKANRVLNWKAKRDLQDMCSSTWRWQTYLLDT